MLDRLDRTALMHGVDDAGRSLIEQGFRVAMVARLEVISDDHHPDYLHPGRTAAILLDDVGLNEPVALAAACLLDTQRPELEPTNPYVLDRVGQEVLDLRESVPRPGSERLLEDLLGSGPQVVLVALAERLDHLRHAHLRGDLEAARVAHAEGSAVYLALAERTHPLLARRYTHCCRAFSKKYAT
jgi:(p)ppGpp synthase/HD superfamily hydrolase